MILINGENSITLKSVSALTGLPQLYLQISASGWIVTWQPSLFCRGSCFSFYALFIQNFWKFLISIKYQTLKNNNNKKDSLVTALLSQDSEEQRPVKRFWRGWAASNPHEVSLWTAMLWKSHENVIKNPGKHFSGAWIQIFHFHGLFFRPLIFYENMRL